MGLFPATPAFAPWVPYSSSHGRKGGSYTYDSTGVTEVHWHPLLSSSRLANSRDQCTATLLPGQEASQPAECKLTTLDSFHLGVRSLPSVFQPHKHLVTSVLHTVWPLNKDADCFSLSRNGLTWFNPIPRSS